MKIVDPGDERVPIRRRLATRHGAVKGTVALLDISKPRGDVLIDQLRQELGQRLPGIEVKLYRKPTFTRPAPDDLRRKIKEECGFVIEALAD